MQQFLSGNRACEPITCAPQAVASEPEATVCDVEPIVCTTQVIASEPEATASTLQKTVSVSEVTGCAS
ncbi:hypothetical protein G5B30_03400 [Sphingobacterium sp. SGG-5]|uniref:hypothetical protein n=1 Tax=Sphingobacterium sp. SGG-5 TaxID=2710881 RepID=UPI0013E9C3C8|nr:hypothetical protein [Sphingobacterium sp. SGG-5]NGM60957.1 hypothetical protein [Sphingobacterium sp. SGG-5]